MKEGGVKTLILTVRTTCILPNELPHYEDNHNLQELLCLNLRNASLFFGGPDVTFIVGYKNKKF